jgi:glycerol-3-phosphate dehydrogenase
MAQDAIDAVLARRGATRRRLAPGPSRTTRLALVGAAAPDVLASLTAPRRLIQRYGAEAPAVLALSAEEPSLMEPVAPGLPVSKAELAWAIRHEGALDESDLLDRRTRIGLVAADRDAALPAARDVLGSYCDVTGRVRPVL